jgi:hypothetical protein
LAIPPFFVPLACFLITNTSCIMKSFLRIAAMSLFLLCVPYACTPDDDDDDTGDARDLFIGSWRCRETSSIFGISTYTVKLTKNQDNHTQVLLENFYQFGPDDYAYAIVSANEIMIPRQTFCDHTLSGKGVIDSKGLIIDWDYVVENQGAEIDSCYATYEKQ